MLETCRHARCVFAAAVAAAFAGLAACGAPPVPGSTEPVDILAASDDAPLRAMSFNIRYGTADDGDDAWPLRRELVLRVIDDFGPTVVGLQEALRFQLDEIEAALPQFGEVGVGRDDGRVAGEYSAILYDTRRLEVLDSGTFWLSDTPEVPGSTSWGNGITRIATWARFRDAAGDRRFYVFNTHWDHESQPSRERSAGLVLERIATREHPDPVLVTGDFNAGEDNPAFRQLVSDQGEVSLRDPFRRLHPDSADVGTFNAFRGESTGEKIDAVLASPEWAVLEAQIVRSHLNGRYPSDHFPVTAVVRQRVR